jgi:hypothetical protein
MNVYKQVLEQCPIREPHLWQTFYPRIYRHTERWGDPKVAAATLTPLTAMARDAGYSRTKAGDSTINIAYVGAALASLSVPTMFVAPELLASLSQSTPPAELRWDAIELPFESALLMLPRGFLFHPKDGAIDYIAYGRFSPDSPITFPSRDKSFKLIEPTFILFTSCRENPTFPALDLTLNSSTDPYIGVEDIPLGINRTSAGYDIKLEIDEMEFLNTYLSLTFRILLGLEARPALLSSGSRAGLHKKSRKELWTPNIIGRDYRYKTESSGSVGTHASPRIHWRRGHFRRQAIGAGYSEHKTVWIEPVLVGGR